MNPRVVIRVNAGVILAIGLALLVPLALLSPAFWRR